MDYIVVGAGIAGLAAADHLRELGHNVLVLECEDKPGGRMASVMLGDVPADLGAQFIATKYKNILAASRRIGLQTIKLRIKKTGIHHGNSIDYLNPESPLSILAFKGLKPINRLRALLGLGWTIVKPPYIRVERLEDGLSLDHEKAATYFAKSTGQEVVTNLLDPVLNGLAFYDLDNSSAGYFKAAALKLLTLKTLSYPKGIGELSQHLASKGNIVYGARVQGITRQTKTVKISVQLGKKSLQITAKNVIVAVPGDRVLGLLETPTQAEKTFFSSVRYTSAVILHCRSKTGLPDGNSVVFFRPSTEKRIAAIHLNPYAKGRDATYFVVTLANDYANDYMHGKVSQAEVSKLIESKIGKQAKLEILHSQNWPSAVPIYHPGYITKLTEFEKTITPRDLVLYCGDYLKGGFTEAAFTSGTETAKLALK